MVETRQVFQGISSGGVATWYVLSAVSTVIFGYGVVRLFLRARGRPRSASAPSTPLRARIAHAARVVFTHTWIARRAGFVGWAHAFVFYGFLVLFAGTTILAINQHIASPLGLGFWQGTFYLGYSLFLDVFGFLLVVGLLMLVARRAIVRPPRLRYAQSASPRYAAGDWLLLISLLYLGVSGFILEALRDAGGTPSFEKWAPFGWLLGRLLHDAGLNVGSANNVRLVIWWLHGVVALTFVAAIPFTKAAHMVVAPTVIASHDPEDGRRLGDAPLDSAEATIGYRRLADFDGRHLLELSACTRCGKCHEACPATASGAPLSPRDLILDLGRLDLTQSIIDDERIRPETVWACMSCMACVEICPVGIEHVPIIAELRRGMVEDGVLMDGLDSVLTVVQRTGNSFGANRRQRPRWTAALSEPIKDARKEPVQWLWYVGDYAAFDPRNQRATVALARVLQFAGIDVGILYEGEQTAGNDIRRVGEEGLFQSLVERNVEAIAGCSFERILTSDPHTFNTLKNEYPRLGAPWEPEQVVHHSGLLRDLLRDGRVRVREPIGMVGTYHDPCALGRYNGEYDAPREVIGAVGVELVEMPRNRDNSFCCGAGGGRIWMKEQRPSGGRRASEQRIDEAVELGAAELFVVACPKDVTMYEDAIKTSGHDGVIALRELSELVAQAVGIDPAVTAESTRA